MSAIQTFGLTKTFGDLVAVDHLNMEVKRGEIFGLLGPNGSGKTTTIRMLCTLLTPTLGTASVAGFDILKEPSEVRKRIGVVSDGIMLYEELSGLENLRLLGRLYRLSGSGLHQRVDELLSFVRLKGRERGLVRTYSTGMRKGLMIAAAILHQPEIVYLDEPTTGLDPRSAVGIRELARDLCDRGFTVIWTTHYMEEPEKVCDRVGIFFNGRLVKVDTPRGVRAVARDFDIVEIEADGVSDQLIHGMEAFEGVVGLTFEKGLIRVRAKDGEGLLPELVSLIEREKGVVRSARIIEPSLEDAFIKLTGGSGE